MQGLKRKKQYSYEGLSIKRYVQEGLVNSGRPFYVCIANCTPMSPHIDDIMIAWIMRPDYEGLCLRSACVVSGCNP